MPYDNPMLSATNPYYRQHSPEVSGLAEYIFGPLKWVGESISKPAAALRGILAGQPGQLANLIPFSDTLGITDPEQRVSGRDMLRSWGLVGNQNNGGNFLGGLLAEVLTDPTMLAAGLGGMGKMTSLVGKATGAGEAATVGQALGSVGGKAQALGQKAMGMVPQGVKNLPGKVGGAMDDFTARMGMPRMFTQGGDPNLVRKINEARAQLPTIKASGGTDAMFDEMLAGIKTLEQQAGGTPLLQRGMNYASDMARGLGDMPGMGMMQGLGQRAMNLPAGAMVPALSVGSSAYDMGHEAEPGPDPMQMMMLMQQLQSRRKRDPFMEAAMKRR